MIVTSRLPCRSLLAGLALTLLSPGLLRGQMSEMTMSVPPEGATVDTAVIGERYDAGSFKRWLLGGGYRDVWTSPVEIPVLDLRGTHGGLTPVETGGYGQTFTLEFIGGDGLEYAVRSIDKDPTRRLDSIFVGTIVERVVQDQVSQFLPTAGLIVDPLLEAVGILHPRHEMVVIPDDPALGEFRDEFPGLIGMLTDRPQEGPDDTPGFAGSARIVGTDTFLEELEEGACNRADAREYLKARMMDMLIGDRDRHEGQWRWARFPEGPDCWLWRTIPEDRDQAFIHSDGLVMSIYRLIRPQQVRFDASYPSLIGLTFNAWELDRQLLVPFERDIWNEVAREIQRELTDDVIDAAVRRLPDSHYALVGERITRNLESRRDRLEDFALEYYEFISRQAAIKATDRDERAVFTHLPNGDLDVSVRYLSGPQSEEPYFHRIFHRAETDEVRLRLQGGDDVIEVRGESGDIKVRAIGGGGDDRFLNASGTGAADTHFYDDRGDNEFEGAARIDRRPFERPPATNLVHRYALDWGGIDRYIPQISYSPDHGLLFGATVGRRRYGFRKVPWWSDNAFGVQVSTNGPEFFLNWDARYREAFGRADLVFEAEYTGRGVLRFYGFGNETSVLDDVSSDFFRVDQRHALIAPGLEWVWGRLAPQEQEVDVEIFRPTVTFGFGPVLKFASAPVSENDDNLLGTVDPAPLGIGRFGQFGARAWFEVDGRNREAYPTSGFRLQAGASGFPGAWDAPKAFGEVHGSVATYLTPGSARRSPTLALRAGGQKNFGTFPFHEAAFIGGTHDLRGYHRSRFAGEAAAYGNAELRLPLATFYVLFPTELGVVGAADAGRVFFDGDRDGADKWHSSVGGGIFLNLLNRSRTVSLMVMSGEITGIYLNAGLHF